MTPVSFIIDTLAFATLIGWLTWAFVVDWRRMHRKPLASRKWSRK